MDHFHWRLIIAEHERREREILRLHQRRWQNGQMPVAPRQPKLYHRLLAYVGRKLVDLGWQLQTPYNRMTTTPALNSRPSDRQLRLNC